MVFSIGDFRLKRVTDYVDWKLLVFLILFLNIKLEIKFIAILFIYLFQFDFKFGFKLKNSRLPLFYLFIIPIACIAFIVNKSYLYPKYMPEFITGISFWVLSILAIHQIKLIVEKIEAEKIHRTIIVFFIINFIISVFNLVVIMLITRSINPYTFKGMHQIYFIMTGDYIKGLSFDISSTNAVLSAFGVIYFLYKKMPVLLFICMATLLLTCSNLINLILLVVIAGIFILKSSRDQKSYIVICIMMFLVFMIKISPQNKGYSVEIIKNTLHIRGNHSVKPAEAIIPLIKRPDSLLNTDEKKQKIALINLSSIKRTVLLRPLNKQTFLPIHVPLTDNGRIYINSPNTNSEEYWLSKEIGPDQRVLLNFIAKHKNDLPMSRKETANALPGKALGMLQTLSFFYKHPAKVITGLGIGNFSSKIAFRATGLGLRGRYPEKYAYINSNFLSNHLDLYLSFFSGYAGNRSVSNNPFSVYDQLLSEYGLLGLLSLIIYYMGFFFQQKKHLTYGIPLLLFVIIIFFLDYWFEQLSIMVLFELLLFLNIKENEKWGKLKEVQI